LIPTGWKAHFNLVFVVAAAAAAAVVVVVVVAAAASFLEPFLFLGSFPTPLEAIHVNLMIIHLDFRPIGREDDVRHRRDGRVRPGADFQHGAQQKAAGETSFPL